MAYDEELVDRIRDLVEGPNVTEQRMFGGLAFLFDGKMAVAASGQGGLLVRVDPTTSDELIASTPAEAMVMRGAPMLGWLHVPAEDLRTARQLSKWVQRGTSFTRSLPPKNR